MTGLAAMLTVNLLTALRQTSYVKLLRKLFLVLPNYCFGQGISDLYSNFRARKLIKTVCQYKSNMTLCGPAGRWPGALISR